MLIEQTQKYSVDTEKQATELIEKFRAEQMTGEYDLSKAGYTSKDIKSKGEVIGKVYTVTITKKFV